MSVSHFAAFSAERGVYRDDLGVSEERRRRMFFAEGQAVIRDIPDAEHAKGEVEV